ncbi:hypothetical protein Dd1591_0651 [Dickeya chrysanthemi Ech1591]|uniref:Uncharacterized protein n=1 Tax=Dickeya chrysanthemi (strain Ech1591) TaxID=561229 RepID=C6CK17_DICC1|nr:hypothetical protein [Dickeya chrysanthemi]ACT05533.1 hypothetical protein Dd1591_0651 [Dickeya chrysanthemi Ech1591]WJM84569.1 hypothetical protein QUF31_15720 [Dickeya chrysanthemi]
MMTRACLIDYPTRQWWVVTPENKAQGKPQTVTTSRGGGQTADKRINYRMKHLSGVKNCAEVGDFAG